MLRILVVSPHRDDAAFSCAIAIRALSNSCAVTVANYFTVSEYAPFRIDSRQSVSDLRLHEDQAFASLAGIELDDLDLVDAPERLEIDVSQISTTRPLDSADAIPRATIVNHVRRKAPDLLFVPLAIGDHIDHRIAQSAAIESGIRSLAFYEDLPYFARTNESAAFNRALSLDLDLSSQTFRCERGREWKERCASLYSSQIDASTVQEISAFSERYQEGERLWLTPSAVDLLRPLLVC